jgi:hypothetical protein
MKYFLKLLTIYFFLPFISSAQTPPANPVPGPAVISIGKKKNTKSIGKNELLDAAKLSAFYFSKSNIDSVHVQIKHYTVSVFQKNSSIPGSTLDLNTDAFSEQLIQMIKSTADGSRISFENIKAVLADETDHSVFFLQPLTLTLKQD